tara:strand:- start:1406 stop:1876 length:471 start_codon:yes stop_codon:yes gene_type:complete
MNLVIFDLDETVIDSSHRQKRDANGNLDLQHWLENQTRNKMFRDTLMPLADYWRDCQEQGMEIAVCTSRTARPNDVLSFLAYKGLRVDYYMRRLPGDERSSAELKVDLLSRFFKAHNPYFDPKACEFFDDLESVREAVTKTLGVKCIDPATWQKVA